MQVICWHEHCTIQAASCGWLQHWTLTRLTVRIKCYRDAERCSSLLVQKLLACILCGVRGHVARSCPESLCFNCHRPGHAVRDCDRRRIRYEICRRCGMRGHIQTVGFICIVIKHITKFLLNMYFSNLWFVVNIWLKLVLFCVGLSWSLATIPFDCKWHIFTYFIVLSYHLCDMGILLIFHCYIRLATLF